MPTTNDLSLYILTAPQQPESTSEYTGNFLRNDFDSITFLIMICPF